MKGEVTDRQKASPAALGIGQIELELANASGSAVPCALFPRPLAAMPQTQAELIQHATVGFELLLNNRLEESKALFASNSSQYHLLGVGISGSAPTRPAADPANGLSCQVPYCRAGPGRRRASPLACRSHRGGDGGRSPRGSEAVRPCMSP